MNGEEKYLKSYNKELYEKPSVAVDLLVFTIENDRLKIVLVKREEYPFKDRLALPGVFVNMDETLDEAAKRGIFEEAGIKDIYFEQLYTWGEVERDPRMRIISVSYLSLIPCEKLQMSIGKRTSLVELYDVEELLTSDDELAFDHKKMIEYARERIKNKTEYTRIAFEFLEEEFTLPRLQKVYEILLGKSLYKSNFRRKIMSMVEETNSMTSGEAHRPSKIYRVRSWKDYEI